MYLQRLENQLTEVIDLQQQGGQQVCIVILITCNSPSMSSHMLQVSELQKQLAQIQTHTMDKLQDFDDTIDEYQSKVHIYIHKL